MNKKIDFFNLIKCLNEDSQKFSEEKLKNILGMIRIADINGLVTVTGISQKKASKLIHKFNEDISNVAERKVFQTSDTRKLKQGVLTLFSEEASSQITKNRFLSLTPTLDNRIIHVRLSLCELGKKIFDELKIQGKLNEVKNMLKNVSIKTSIPKKTFGLSAPDNIQYFVSRNQIIKIAYIISEKFRSSQTLSTFFQDIDKKDMENIIKTVEEIKEYEIKDAEAVIYDAEILLNEKLREGIFDGEKVKQLVEDYVVDISSTLKMNWEEETALGKAALEQLSIPVEFDRAGIARVIERWNQRQSEESVKKLMHIENSLKEYWNLTEQIVEKIILLDQILSIASMMEKYSLSIPTLSNGGNSFINGCNIFLIKEKIEGKIDLIQPVNYSLGKTQTIQLATPRNAVMLTGANSGGKTTLLTTVATISILTLLGLPVPCERAEITPMPIYLFRRRMTRKIGSLEQALNSLIPIFANRERKLVLIDEFEALTEPGAAGRIIATLMNRAAISSNLVLLVTHLAQETLPHVKLPIRIDGIEATGLDKNGELIVNRQPNFNHMGSSTPKFIIKKLAKATKKKRVKLLYDEILITFEDNSKTSSQTPLNFPWIIDESIK